MDKRKLSNWLKSAKLIDTKIKYGCCGNKCIRSIYKKHGQLYSIEFCTREATMVEDINYIKNI